MDLGANIRRVRLQAGLTQKELGERIGVEGNTISDWERGRSEPQAKMILAIAEACNVPVSELFRPAQDEEQQQVAKAAPPKDGNEWLDVFRMLASALEKQSEANLRTATAAEKAADAAHMAVEALMGGEQARREHAAAAEPRGRQDPLVGAAAAGR